MDLILFCFAARVESGRRWSFSNRPSPRIRPTQPPTQGWHLCRFAAAGPPAIQECRFPSCLHSLKNRPERRSRSTTLSPEAHYALSRVLEAELEFSSAEREIRSAIALDPTRSIYHRTLSTLHGWESRPKEELAEARLSLETDPLNPYAHVALGSGLAANGHLDEALVELDRVAAIQPPLQAVAFVAAQDYAQQQRLPEAIAILRPQAEGGDPSFQGLLGCFLARAGQRDEANRVLADLLARFQRTGVGAFEVAMVHAGLGDFDQTFMWLNKSIDDRSISTMIMGHTFEDLRRDPRFQKLNERLGLPGR